MLEPHDRRVLLDALRPPEGYSFDEGIGTTFTLDLLALLTAPLGFTMLELQDSRPGEIGEGDALLLLKTLRQYANRLTIFCQAGRIALPRGQGRLLASLEESVVEVAAPSNGGVFHPKVWALRYIAPDAPVAYRLLVLSRNLTFDRSWDTMVVLDGLLQDRANAIAMNHPLGNFVQELPGLAIRSVEPIVAERAQRFQHELRRVDFLRELPPGVTDLSFHPIGIAGHTRNPIRGRVDRMLVISPFLSASRLNELGDDTRGDILVSRADELGKLSSSQLENFSEVFALSQEAVEPVEADTEKPAECMPDAGLHAKVFVADAGWEARVWTGSANATSAALRRNVEFLVELTGKKSDLGIDALLTQRDGVTGLRDLLVPFVPADLPPTEDPDHCAAEEALDSARLAIAGAGWAACVSVSSAGYDLELKPLRMPALAPEVKNVKAYPVMLPESAGKAPEDQLRFLFADLTLVAITSFFAFEVQTQVGSSVAKCRFVVNAELHGAPPDRREALLRSLLRDRRQVLRFLLLLLADDDQLLHGDVGGQLRSPGEGAAGGNGSGAEALLETLLRTLHRNPQRLDDVERLMLDLEATETPEDPLVPVGLREVLVPLLAARRSGR